MLRLVWQFREHLLPCWANVKTIMLFPIIPHGKDTLVKQKKTLYFFVPQVFVVSFSYFSVIDERQKEIFLIVIHEETWKENAMF